MKSGENAQLRAAVSPVYPDLKCLPDHVTTCRPGVRRVPLPRPLEYTICRKKPVVVSSSADALYTNQADMHA